MLFRLLNSLPLLTRLFIRTRWLLFNPQVFEEYLPDRGKFVDIGCGHGVWAIYLAGKFPSCEIIGFEPDRSKIEIAKSILDKTHLSNVRFTIDDQIFVDLYDVSVFFIIDVLYLMPYEKQVEVISKCYDRLNKGGILIIKTMSDKPAWKFLWNLFEEVLAVRVFKFTMGENFFFRDEIEWVQLFESLGFLVEVRRLDKGYIHPHIGFVCVKA